MDPDQLIPTPDVLPAPWVLFNVLLVVTFTFHLLVVNLMLGGGPKTLHHPWSHVFHQYPDNLIAGDPAKGRASHGKMGGA